MTRMIASGLVFVWSHFDASVSRGVRICSSWGHPLPLINDSSSRFKRKARLGPSDDIISLGLGEDEVPGVRAVRHLVKFEREDRQSGMLDAHRQKYAAEQWHPGPFRSPEALASSVEGQPSLRPTECEISIDPEVHPGICEIS